MYALVNALPSWRLATVNLANGNVNIINSRMDEAFFTLACSLDGTLYGVSDNGNLYTINKTTGAITLVGPTGILPEYHQSMAFDHNTERLFWAMSRTTTDEYGKSVDQGKLMEIDTKTGRSILLGTTGAEAEIVALYTPFTHVAIPEVNAGENVFGMYPNPSQGTVHLTAVEKGSRIQVLDVSGRTLQTYDQLSGNVSLNLNLANGIYFVRIENNGKQAVQKLIIK
jgi:DNA-binding beta-propeller fold protein YncE